jgi:hypothetical protein
VQCLKQISSKHHQQIIMALTSKVRIKKNI